MSLKDQVVLVTGSSGGIGDAAVSAFTAAGAIVLGADRSSKDDQALEAFYLGTTMRSGCAGHRGPIRPH
jgi:NAD(P)-dependent dehydrogenase (short-subunit alcohol dehydrogenase family)